MRRFILIVMVLLVPLRGWAFFDMRLNFMAPPSATHHAAPVEMPPDCHMLSSKAQGAAPSAPPLSSDSGFSLDATGCHCQTCQLCAALAAWTLMPLAVPPPVWSDATRPRLPSMGFASADLARLSKPPIA